VVGGLLWGAGWLVVGAVLTGVFGLTSWPVLFAVGSFVMLGLGPIAAGGYVYTPEQFPTRMRAWAISTCTTWIRAVSTVMPIIIGTILGSWVGLTGAWMLSAVPLLFGGFWILKFGIETRGRVLEELAA
jgi:putative MFS transporter